MGSMEDRPKASRVIRVELSGLPRKPHSCPAEVEGSWNRFVATRESVAELFTAFNEQRAAQRNPQGPIHEKHKDLARAAIVFTAAGIDACLRTLLRSSLAVLLRQDGAAHGAFVKHFQEGERLRGDLTKATKNAIVALDPRAALIDLYVTDLTGSSIQGWRDLRGCRDALGISGDALKDEALKTHQDFFDARHEVVHELDLIEPSGKGTRSRRSRDVREVGRQCDEALLLIYDFIVPTAKAVKASG